MSSSYQHLPTEPPTYDVSENIELPGQSNSRQQYHTHNSDPFYIRAQRFTNSKIIRPVRQLLDPVAEGYADLVRLSELYMAKLGNPLIVKRIVYVVFISFIMLSIMKTGLLPQESLGASSSFSDVGKLVNFVNENVNLKSMEENLEYLSSINHEAGTIGDLALAKFVHASFKQQHHSIRYAQLMEVQTLLDYPEKITLSYEDVELDLFAQFNPLSKDTESLEAGVIYANYGRLSDYQQIMSSGTPYESKIAIVKIGQIPIFQKIEIAESLGISAILFINEYRDHPDSFTPVSAALSNFYPGDPLTPGYSSSLSENRIELGKSDLANIPTVSLSRSQASPILDKLKNEGITFLDGLSSGDGKFTMKLTNILNYKKDHSIWNVVGKIEGREQPDQALIIGARRDSLTRGTMSANSGTALLLQLIELFNKLSIKLDWKPLRSVYFVSFDGSDYNFAGATELVEGKIAEIQKDIIAYIDVSGGISGDQLTVKSTGLLDSKINEFANDFPFTWSDFNEYTNSIPFLQYAVPIVELSYQSSSSIYPKFSNEDTFDTFKSLNVDDDFSKFAQLTKLISRLALHILDDPLIPFDISSFVTKLDHHYRQLQTYQESKINEKLNYNPLISALLRLTQIGKDFQLWKDHWAQLVQSDAGVEPSLLAIHRWGWNSRLNILEKLFIDVNGISDSRRTFKNVVSGPQFHKPETGDQIDWFSFPSIRDVIDKGGDVQAEIERVGKVIVNGIDYFLQR